MDIEKILFMYEDDYNPSSMVPGPRNMASGGQVVIGKPGGLVQPETKFYAIKKTIKGTGDNAGNISTYVGGRDNQIRYIGSQEYIDKIRKDNPKFGKTGPTVHEQRADKAAVNKKAIIKNFKDNLGIDVEVGKNNLVAGKGLTEELKQKIANAQSQYRKKNPGQAGLTNEGFWEFYSNIDKNKEAAATAAAEKEAAKMKAKSPDFIRELDRPLKKSEITILNKSYDNIFLEEFDRLKNEGDLFSKTDLNRAVINRIADENPTIDIANGKGLDKVFDGNENHKSMHERTDGGKTSLISNKDKIKYFTKNTNALNYTKSQDRLLQALVNGVTDFDDLMVELDFNEGRLNGNLNKLMRNLAYSDESKKPLFFKNYSEQELEKAQNAVFESPTLESTYQRTALQSIYESTKRGSAEQKKAIDKYKEFNKFKRVMKDNGLEPKMVVMDHAASYRALKNGNIKNFLAMTPIMSDINSVKSTFDRRSQLNLRRMQDAINSGDNVSYKKFLKNQKELEGIWKTMTGDQSSLGEIRIGATGKKKGVAKITDYGATSILDKNKNLLKELGDNLVIRENIVKASNQGNLAEVSRIMEEGSAAEKPRPSRLPESFKRLNKPEMFDAENQIRTLLTQLCPRGGSASGGRIGFANAPNVACGREQLQKLLFQGGGTGKERGLLQRIISGGGKMALSMLNPKELLRLSNLVGPAALGIMAGYEMGSITDDVLRLNKPLDESLAGNWLTKAFMPFSEEFAKQKNLLQSGKLTGEDRNFALEMMKMENFMKEGKKIEAMEATQLLDDTGYGNIDGSPMVSKEKLNKAYGDMFLRLMRMKPYAFGTTDRGARNQALMDEFEDKRLSDTGGVIPAVSEDDFRLKGQRKIRRDEDYDFANKSIWWDPDRLVNKADRPKNMTRGPITEKGKMKLDYHIPGYTPYDQAYTPSDEEVLQLFKNYGIVHPRFGQLEPGAATKFRMNQALANNRSIYGVKEYPSEYYTPKSEGGITGLRSKYEYKK